MKKNVFFYLFMFVVVLVIAAFSPKAKAEELQLKKADTILLDDLNPPYNNSITKVSRWNRILIREAKMVYGLEPPVPMFLGQIMQESGGDPKVTAWDLGRGLGQFMDGTTTTVSRMFPELGKADPYNPLWSLRALLRYDLYLYKSVKGDTECQRWAAGLKGYNAGLGYVLQAQKKSPDPGQWFGTTEFVQTRQSPKNFEYSRMYPRWILFKHQPKFAQYGRVMCSEIAP